MRTATLFAGLAAAFTGTVAVSATHVTLMPRAEPTTVTRDPWQCATTNLTKYFDVPKPTGSLSTALESFNSELRKTCLAAGTPLLYCPFPAQSSWCGFTTAAPSEVLPDYSSFGSRVSSWWSQHSSEAVSLAKKCPVGWSNAMFAGGHGETWLNTTIAFAECYAEAHTTDESSTTRPTATALSGVTRGGPTSTDAPDSAVGRAEGAKMLMVAGIGFAAVAVNYVW